MTEKGSPILLLLLLGLLYWASIPTVPDPTQCDLLDSTPLIETMREASKTLESSNDHEADFAIMQEASKTLELTRVPEEDFGKVDPMPSPSDKHEATKREILVFLAPKDQKCEPCDRWKRCEMQRFMDANWEVAIFDEPHNYGRTPTFELKSGNKKATLTGYITLEQAGEAVR
jgi:hypothetical protein